MPTNSLPEELVAQLACERLLIRLFHCLDARDYEGVAACFAEDSLWLRQGKELRGPAQVLNALNERTATIHVHHLLSNIDLRLSGESRANCIAYMTVYRSDTGKPPQLPIAMQGPELVAVCTAELRRGKDDWRVMRLATTITYLRTVLSAVPQATS
jgi:ketosteroid isomerase-like protein